MHHNVKSTGMSIPDRITASSSPSTNETLNMAIPVNGNRGILVYSFATTFLHPNLVGDCRDSEDRLLTASIIVNWLERVASNGILGGDGLYLGGFADGAEPALALEKLDPSEQVAWIEGNREAILNCSIDLIRLP